MSSPRLPESIMSAVSKDEAAHADRQDITDGDHTTDAISFSSPSFSYMNPKIQLRRIKWGIGMFSNSKLYKDEVLIGWAGRVVHISQVLKMKPEDRHYVLQIDDELFQAPFWQGYNEPADFTNHSCNPNCGFGNSAVTLVAMRDIEVGEELTFDYSMADSVEGIEADWICLCGSDLCRGNIRGSDWKLPALWERYQSGDYFSPYLRRKIVKLRKDMGLPEPIQASDKAMPEVQFNRVGSFGLI
eukprot:TRINITY_DN2211_c0_g1_i1.p1 TRINITY_DN2211_c0_g1~~TRINITY_DN2211_c0_g1_i1.p1  ORF type:complete len:243 (-),score=77.24 TRINITY_DN2211_c0_g1_i1:25-753(-)